MITVFMRKLVRFFAFLGKLLALLTFIFFAGSSLNLKYRPLFAFCRAQERLGLVERQGFFFELRPVSRGRLIGASSLKVDGRDQDQRLPVLR